MDQMPKMHQMPSQAVLQSAINETFQLHDDHGAAIGMTLQSVQEGVGIDCEHVCYSAIFELPKDLAASQGTYRVCRESGEQWSLFLAPIRPNANGNARLEAVFHYRASRITE